MLTQHIALVPESDGVNASELARVSAALQKQVIRDVAPFWGIAATVDAFPRLEDVPVGYFPIIVSLCELGPEAGVYLDGNGNPYAQIELWPSWSLDASRACIEMLVNPPGNRSVSGSSPRSDQGPVDFLVEACAPCAGPRYAYAVNDVIVSDFCTPAFFGRTGTAQNERYSFTAAVDMPFEVLQGGHMTWYDPASNSWWRRSHFGDSPLDTRLDQSGRQIAAMRELVRGEITEGADRLTLESFEARLGITRKRAMLASQVQAQRLRALLGQGPELLYTSLSTSRGSRGHASSGRNEAAGLLRDSRSAAPFARRDEKTKTSKPELEIDVEHDWTSAESTEPRVNQDAAPAQAVSSKPPPFTAASQAPSAAPSQPEPLAAAVPAAPQTLPPHYVSGYPQMPAVVFTNPPAPPPHSGARDTAFLLGGALVAAALLLAVLLGGRDALAGAVAPAQASAPLLYANVPHGESVPAVAPPAVRATEDAQREPAASTAQAAASTSLAAAPTVSVPRVASTDDRNDRNSSSSHRHRDMEKASHGDSEPTASKSASAAPPIAPLALDELLDTRR